MRNILRRITQVIFILSFVIVAIIGWKITLFLLFLFAGLFVLDKLWDFAWGMESMSKKTNGHIRD